VLEELADAKTRAVAEKVFRALAGECGVGEGPGEVLKLEALCESLGEGERDVAFVVDAFRREGSSFVLPPAVRPLTGCSLVEISYEEVIHSWWRLKSWAEVSGQAS
jgi:hypothetical protein